MAESCALHVGRDGLLGFRPELSHCLRALLHAPSTPQSVVSDGIKVTAKGGAQVRGCIMELVHACWSTGLPDPT